MGCASSKDIDEVEKRKGKKGSQSEKPFDRPGIKYIDENTSKQPIDDKVSPRDAELEANEDSKGQDVNGVQEEDPNKLTVTATTEEGEVAVNQIEGPAPDEIKVTATTEEGEVHISQDSDNVDTSRTEQTSASDTQAEGSSVDNALHSNQVPDAIHEYAEQLADEVQKDSIRQLEREVAEEQPQGLPEPLQPEGSSVDALQEGKELHVVASDGSIVDQNVEESDVVKATEAPQEPAEVQLEAPSGAEGADQSQAQDAVKQTSQDAPATKSEGGVDPALEGAQLEDRFYNNQSFKKPDVDASDPQQQEAATRIQTKYRQYHAKREVQHKREEKAAIKIQAGFRGMHDRHKVKEQNESLKHEAQDDSKPEEKSEEMTEAAGSEVQVSKDEQAEQDADTQEAAEESHSKDINLEDPDVEKAATTIQAGFKGMKARQEVKALKESRSPEEDNTEAVQENQEQEDKKDISYDDPEVEQAATKIQSGFRGMKARREVQELKESKLGDSQENVSEEQADKEKESTGKEETQETAEETQAETGEAQPEQDQEDKVQIDTEDPDVQAAATKIQAGFRGYQTRKEMKEKTDVPADTQEVTDEQTDNQQDDTPATESTEQKPE